MSKKTRVFFFDPLFSFKKDLYTTDNIVRPSTPEKWPGWKNVSEVAEAYKEFPSTPQARPSIVF